MHFIFRLPTADEAEIIRHYVGVAKKAVFSDEVLAQKREAALMARRLIGPGPALGDAPGIPSSQTPETEQTAPTAAEALP